MRQVLHINGIFAERCICSLLLINFCLSRNLWRFNQNPEWDVRQVLPIRGFFMSSPHLTASDKKLLYYGRMADIELTSKTNPPNSCLLSGYIFASMLLCVICCGLDLRGTSPYRHVSSDGSTPVCSRMMKRLLHQGLWIQ